MTVKASCVLLALVAFCGAAPAETRDAWRPIPALQQFRVTHCLGDRRLVAVSRAAIERVVIVTEHPAVPDLGVAASSERTPPFPI